MTARTHELTHSQQRFKDFAKTVGDWFWEVDTEFKFTYISSPHLANHIVDNDSILDIFEENNPLKKQLQAKFEMKETFEDLEWQLPESEGGTWISFSGTPYFSKQGKLLGYRGTAKDITNRKKRIFELKEARKQAESANKAKSQFLAMMSHEIRTPLNAVLGFMDTLSESGLSNEQKHWVNQMDQSAQLLLTIINDILDLSRIESGNFELFNSMMRLEDSVSLVVNQLNDQAVKKNISLTMHIEPGVPEYIIGDKNRISQVMFNLIGNAIKFTNEGSVSVDITSDDRYIAIAVNDTGIGIAPEAQINLFNPFCQADGSITRRYGGTGLGLAISQHLINKMNGKITLESQLDKGSRFTVYIPKVQQANISAGEEPVAEVINLQPMNILLAEDSNTNQMIARLMLEKRGHHVTIANNGEEAVQILEQDPECFDIVLMDISMPVLDGLQATRILRQKNIDLPIIALTANAMHSDQVEYKSAGMDGFLAKPIRAAELTLMLSSFQSQAFVS